MTKKEEFYRDYLRVKNEISKMKGDGGNLLNLEEFVNTREFHKKADYLTFAKLDAMMADAQAEHEKYFAQQKLATWKESEEGKKYIAIRKARMEDILKGERELIDNTREIVRKSVRPLLGEQWDVVYFGKRSMEIAIVEKYLEDGRPIGVFGHNFTIYFDISCYINSKREWKMSYNTLGDFDISDPNNKRIQYLVGMTKFASDTVVVPELKGIIFAMCEELDKCDEEHYKLKNEVDHPQVEL